MKEIVKLGYEELTVNTICYVYIKYYNNAVSTLFEGKEKVKEAIKNELAYYYLKDSLLHKPIKETEIINSSKVEREQYRIVTIPHKKLEFLLVKNKLGGYLTSNIVSEKEFDNTFEESYKTIIGLINRLYSKMV